MAATIRVGTCSFADDSLTKLWYPREIRTGEARLRHYARHFDTVEIDSSYYTLPNATNAARWADRTPEGFLFHVKAFGMMTRHAMRLEQLPPDLRGAVEAGPTGRVEHPSTEVRSEVFRRFHAELAPLRESGRLGGVLMQFPPYVVPRPEAFTYLEWAQEQLRGDTMLVEFRHRSWLDDEHRETVLGFLEDRGLPLVIVDAPRSDAKNVLPTLIATTSDIAYLRMHGRNARTWNIRGGSAADRFDYLYSDEELAEWIEPLRELARASEQAFVFFNNNGRSSVPSTGPAQTTFLSDPGEPATEWIAQAPTNALALRRMLKDAGLPVWEPSSN